jgi:acyl-CoA reductase-like NAD-dependent aldehyde dehydrogenase
MPAYLVAEVEITNRAGSEPYGTAVGAPTTSAAVCAPRMRSNPLGPGQPGLGEAPGHSYGGYKESGIGREFSLEDMLDSFTQRKNVTVNLNTPRRA